MPRTKGTANFHRFDSYTSRQATCVNCGVVVTERVCDERLAECPAAAAPVTIPAGSGGIFRQYDVTLYRDGRIDGRDQ